jgi:hypothetical protein
MQENHTHKAMSEWMNERCDGRDATTTTMSVWLVSSYLVIFVNYLEWESNDDDGVMVMMLGLDSMVIMMNQQQPQLGQID